MPLALRIGSTRTAGARRQALQLAQHLRTEGHAWEVTALQNEAAQVLLALSEREIDVAVVSCTKLAQPLQGALMVAATLPREDITPYLVHASLQHKRLAELDTAVLLASHPLLAAEWRAARPGHRITVLEAHTLHEALHTLHAGQADGLLGYQYELPTQEPGVTLPKLHHPAAYGVWALLARKDDTLLRDWLMRWHSAETLWVAAAEQALVGQFAHLPIQGVQLSITQNPSGYTLAATGVGFSAGGVRKQFSACAEVQKLDTAAIASINNAVVMDSE